VNGPVQAQATITVRSGPLVGPVLSAVVAILAARADCPIDRLDDALLLADAVAAHGPDHSADGRIRVHVAATSEGLELQVCDLRDGGGAALLRSADLPGVGHVLERVADTVEVARDPDEVRLKLAFAAR
jgi:serine/threonine-protein kinase RsbW